MCKLRPYLIFVLAFFSMDVMAGPSYLQQLFSEPDKRWMVRVRAAYLLMDQKSDPIPSLGVSRDAIKISDIAIPELDVSFFITKHIAAELVLTYPQKNNVRFHNSAIGAFKSGSFRHLPPTLMLQYHFMPDSWFRPYVGGGVNYTFFFGEKLAVPGVTGLHLDTGSLGGAAQLGFDIQVTKFWPEMPEDLFLNFDAKKVFIDSKVKNSAGVTISHLNPDPLVISIGLGYKF
jgi:outer membrane protein